MPDSTTTASPPAPAGGESGRVISRYFALHPRSRLAALLTAPLAWIVILYIGSLAMMVIAAFWSVDSFTGALVRNFTLTNFRTLFTEPVYRDVALRSLGVAVAVTIIDAALALPIALYAAKITSSARMRYAIVILTTMPLWAGYLVKAYAWRIMLDTNGVLDWALRPIGLHGPGLGLIATVLALAYLWLPYMILPVYASLDRLPNSLIDASADLGAGPGRTFRSVVVPIILPGIIAGSIFTFSLSLGDYIMVKIVGGTTQMFANIVYDNIGVAGNLPFAAAAATFPILVVVGYLAAVRRTGALENL
jgi:putative spermidine/putrescine transport system permease protein